MEKKSFALPGMKRQKVGHWKAKDWFAKKLYPDRGDSSWPDLVWQERWGTDGTIYALVGELKIENGELVIIRYDEQVKEWLEELEGPICWHRPLGWFRFWQEELETVARAMASPAVEIKVWSSQDRARIAKEDKEIEAVNNGSRNKREVEKAKKAEVAIGLEKVLEKSRLNLEEVERKLKER